MLLKVLAVASRSLHGGERSDPQRLEREVQFGLAAGRSHRSLGKRDSYQGTHLCVLRIRRNQSAFRRWAFVNRNAGLTVSQSVSPAANRAWPGIPPRDRSSRSPPTDPSSRGK